MGKPSRDKGKRGEREVVALAEDHGLPADRTAALQAGGVEGAADAQLRDFPDLHLEVKRAERLELPAWTRQAEGDAPAGSTPVVAYRASREPWRASLPLASLFALLRELRDLRALASHLQP